MTAVFWSYIEENFKTVPKFEHYFKKGKNDSIMSIKSFFYEQRLIPTYFLPFFVQNNQNALFLKYKGFLNLFLFYFF